MSDRRLIVVIDEDKSVCKALERLLRTAQMDVVTYSSIDTFLLASDGPKPDCLVLDVRMQDMKDIDVRNHFGRVGGCIPVVITTTNGVNEPRHAAGAAEDVLRKPFSEKALLDAIGRAIETREAR